MYSLREVLRLPIVSTKHGPDLGSLTEEQAARLARNCPDGTAPLNFGVIYDLQPDPEKFNAHNANINPGRFNLRVSLEERLEHKRREAVTVFVYAQSTT